MSRIVHCLPFYNWLLSLNIVSSKIVFSSTKQASENPSLFNLSTFIHSLCIFSTCSSVDENLGCFYHLADVVNDAWVFIAVGYSWVSLGFTLLLSLHLL